MPTETMEAPTMTTISPAVPPMPQTGWVVVKDGTKYLTMQTYMYAWTTTLNDAIFFCREADALLYKPIFPNFNITVVEEPWT